MKKTVFAIVAVLLCTASAQMDWQRATASAGWEPRSGHTAIDFDGKMWVIGGATGWSPSQMMNDVWWSTDGDSWTRATESAPWTPRCCHTSVVFDSKMWVIGGMHWDDGSSVFYNDVWWSTDGETWVCADSSAEWPGRANHQSVVLGDTMWVIAGVADYSPYILPREAWCSTDGSAWVCITDTAPWSGREAPALEVYHDTMWLMGGTSATGHLRDVWHSVGGEKWTLKSSAAPWSERFAHKPAVFQDKLWATGGLGSANSNDVWYTTDGENWVCADSAAEWRPRASHTTLVYDGRLWVMGGDSTWSFLTTNDVWYSTGLAVEESPGTEVRGTNCGATIARGALRLADGPSSSPSWLLDITGRKVLDLAPGPNDVSRLVPGVYFVRGKDSRGQGLQGSRVRKVIVTR